MFFIGNRKEELTLGPKPEQKPWVYTLSPDKYQSQCQFFYQHAWLFYEHADFILSDHRFYMAHVPIHNGLMYMGDFEDGNLGVYLEWWKNGPDAVRMDKDGNPALTCQFGGSELSGVNTCQRVRPDGKKETFSHIPFGPIWQSFRQIQVRRQAEAREQRLRQYYNMEEVVKLIEKKRL